MKLKSKSSFSFSIKTRDKYQQFHTHFNSKTIYTFQNHKLRVVLTFFYSVRATEEDLNKPARGSESSFFRQKMNVLEEAKCFFCQLAFEKKTN